MIQHISFYKDGKRSIVAPDKNGKFKVVDGERSITSTPKSKYLTATEFVKHHSIKDCDPTITLESGEKLRVYNAGNSFAPLVHPSLVLARYDKSVGNKIKKSALQKKLDSIKKTKSEKKRSTHTTQPMGAIPPIVPPYSGPVKLNKSVKVSNSPPQKKASDADDPFSGLIDEWFGTDDPCNDELNDGLYDLDYPFEDEE